MAKSGRPRQVIQVFVKSTVYDRSRNNKDDRDRLLCWDDSVPTVGGHARDGRMLLNEAILADRDRLESCHTLFVTEYLKPHAPNLAVPPNEAFDYAFLQKGGRLKYGLFGIAEGEAGLEVYLDSSRNRSNTGWPQRTDYKLANLEGAPLRITLNWKSDFTLTGRKERTFHVHDCLFVPLGEFGEFEFAGTEDVLQLVSTGVLKSAKHVDLTERLY